MAKPDPEESRRRWMAGGAIVAITAVTGAVLFANGQPLWCECGSYSPWSSEIWSEHNSQHLADPYSFTHVLHGLIFFAMLRAVFGEGRIELRIVLATAAEAAWELVENSKAVIDAYRESTISLDYYGDSVMNVVGDLGAMLLGYAIAAAVPVWASVAGFALTEIFLALWIRDGLILNVIMLTWPIEAIKQWQMAGAP